MVFGFFMCGLMHGKDTDSAEDEIQISSFMFQTLLYDFTTMRARLNQLESDSSRLRAEVGELRSRCQETPTCCGIPVYPVISQTMDPAHYRFAYEMGLSESMDSPFRDNSTSFRNAVPTACAQVGVSPSVEIPTTTRTGSVVESTFWCFRDECIPGGAFAGPVGALRLRGGVAPKTQLLEWAYKNGATYIPSFYYVQMRDNTPCCTCTVEVRMRGGGVVCSPLTSARTKKTAEKLAVERILWEMFRVPVQQLPESE